MPPKKKQKTKAQKCEECNKDDGVVIQCLRGGVDCRYCVDDDGSIDGRKEPKLRCLDCARKHGRICFVCNKYHCQDCEKYQSDFDHEWHPEADLDISWRRCQHCKRRACSLFDKTCYLKCQSCRKVSCNICIKEKGEEWTNCQDCEDEAVRQSDVYTGGIFDEYCPKCKDVPCSLNSNHKRQK